MESLLLIVVDFLMLTLIYGAVFRFGPGYSWKEALVLGLIASVFTKLLQWDIVIYVLSLIGAVWIGEKYRRYKSNNKVPVRREVRTIS
jgi:hypothetical protein